MITRSYTQTTFSLLEICRIYNKFMSLNYLLRVIHTCASLHVSVFGLRNYLMSRLVLNNNNHISDMKNHNVNFSNTKKLTSFWKNMLSLIFFLLISIAREEHDDTVDRVAIFRLKCWISRGESILASSSRQAPLGTTNQRITQPPIHQSASFKALRCAHNSWAIPFLNSERLEQRYN